jgi:hypothetical protein
MPFFYRFVAQFGSSGQYRCEAVNDAGFDRMEMSLHVFGKMFYLRHHSTENYCKTVCVCVCVCVSCVGHHQVTTETQERRQERCSAVV